LLLLSLTFLDSAFGIIAEGTFLDPAEEEAEEAAEGMIANWIVRAVSSTAIFFSRNFNCTVFHFILLTDRQFNTVVLINFKNHDAKYSPIKETLAKRRRILIIWNQYWYKLSVLVDK
jgi:hypothetical protein